MQTAQTADAIVNPAHPDKKRHLAPHAVTDRPAKNLPQRHADHRHRQSHLRHRCGNGKIRGQLRKRRQVHIRRQRRHCRHHSQKNRQKRQRIHQTPLPAAKEKTPSSIRSSPETRAKPCLALPSSMQLSVSIVIYFKKYFKNWQEGVCG